MKREGEPTRHFFTYYNRTIPENWNAPALTDYNGTTSYTYGEMASSDTAQLEQFRLHITTLSPRPMPACSNKICNLNICAAISPYV